MTSRSSSGLQAIGGRSSFLVARRACRSPCSDEEWLRRLRRRRRHAVSGRAAAGSHQGRRTREPILRVTCF